MGNPNVDESLEIRIYSFYQDDTVDPTGNATLLDASSDVSQCIMTVKGPGPTVSWWVLFLGVRQVITLGLARVAQFLILTYALKMTYCGTLPIGPVTRLFLLQAKGWPLILVCATLFESYSCLPTVPNSNV